MPSKRSNARSAIPRVTNTARLARAPANASNATAPAVCRGAVEHCRPFDPKPRDPDWLTRQQLAASFNPDIGAALEGPARLCRLTILYIIWESHPGQPCAKPAGGAAGFTVGSGRRLRHEPEIVTSIAICRAIPVL